MQIIIKTYYSDLPSLLTAHQIPMILVNDELVYTYNVSSTPTQPLVCLPSLLRLNNVFFFKVLCKSSNHGTMFYGLIIVIQN